jgi:hypothetical protein
VAFVKFRRWIRSIRTWPTDRVIAGASVFIAVCSVLIALSSLTLSIKEARASRQHDRLSVRPRLSISFDYNRKGTGWTLMNDGIGPARIRGFKIFVDEGLATGPADANQATMDRLTSTTPEYVNKVNAANHLDAALKGVPHYFYIDFGQTHEGMGNTLLVVVDKATTTIMSRVPKTYNGFPIKIKVITERQKYWKYNHPGDVPPGCVVSEGPGYRHLVCPVTKPDLRDPIGAP